MDGDADGPATVLVAEDELLIALDLEHRLVRHGYLVPQAVASVAAGLAFLRAVRPDLAVLDLTLEDGPVTPLAEALARCQVPFVLLIGHRCGAIAEPRLRAAPCLPKPWDEGRLAATLRRLLDRDAAARPGESTREEDDGR
jgi:DNA-binding NtrC family response regulator